MGAGCASLKPKRTYAVVHRPFPGVDGATPSNWDRSHSTSDVSGLEIMRPQRGHLQRAPARFSTGGRRSVGAGYASLKPKRTYAVVHRPSPGVDGAAPSSRARSSWTR